MSIIAILVLIAMMCAAIYLTAIYALPILAALATYALLSRFDVSALTIVVTAILVGFAVLGAAQVGASSRNSIVRFTMLIVIAAPAAYAGYSATLQLARGFGAPSACSILLSFIGALTVAARALEVVGKTVRRCDSCAID